MANRLADNKWYTELENDCLSAERLRLLISGFEKTFGKGRELSVFSAPGRTEICGNHTDHQRGCVLAAAVNIDTVAAVSLNGENVIRVMSEGYSLCTIELSDLTPKEDEKNTTPALVRGVAACFCNMGCCISGFDAYIISDVLKGSGLSSSAAFEVLIGVIINSMFFDNKADAVKIAQIGQYAENIYFGKPSGLMDQMASSVGNLVYIDFCDANAPYVERIDYDFSESGHTLCIIDSGADHTELTYEYAAITGEMGSISAYFGKNVLREVCEDDFYAALPKLRQVAGDRAVLRAIHFYNENRRVKCQIEALKSNDFGTFLSLMKESGRSSWMYLQNVIPDGFKSQQNVALTLAVCDKLLCGRGAYRVHGGGFAGTVQAFVPNDMVDSFKLEAESILGENCCHILSVRAQGGMRHGGGE